MNRMKLFHESGLVKAVLHPVPKHNELGSLGREKFRQEKMNSKINTLLEWLKRRGVDTNKNILFSEEQTIREEVDKVLKGNLLSKKRVLLTVGLELTKRDSRRLEREIREASKYPNIYLFEQEFKAKISIGRIIETFTSDENSSGEKDRSSSDHLSALVVLMMIQHGVTDADMAVQFSLAAVHGAYAIKNVPMVGLIANGEEHSENPVLTHKLMLSRSTLYLLKALRTRHNKRFLIKLLQGAAFSDSIRRRLRPAGIKCMGSYEEGLAELGQHISVLRELYTPPYIRELFDGGILSTPLPPLTDYVCTTQQYPRHWPGNSLPGYVQAAVDKVLVDLGEAEICDDKFFSGLSDQIRLVEAIDGGSREDSRITLSEKVLAYMDACRVQYRLTAAQRMLGLFLWYMALVGIPQTLENPSIGTLGTLRTYLSKAKGIILKVYGRSFDIELDDERWEKTLKKQRKSGHYDITTADRVHYFLDCMDALELIEIPSPSLIYKGLKKVDVPACSQLISLVAYKRALKLIHKHYDRADAWLLTFALMLMYRGGLRFCEAYAVKFNQVVVCGGLIDVFVGGRGQIQPKRSSSNRWASLLGDLATYEKGAIEQFMKLKTEGGSEPNAYIYRCSNKAELMLDRVRLQRSVNSCLKKATGCANARGHDCRKTNVNHVILNIILDENGTCRLRQLWTEKLLPKMDIPRKWCRGGGRHAYFGDAVAARFGHRDFSVTVQNYLVYAPELYQYYWEYLGLETTIRPAMTNLSFGDLKTGHERYDYMEKQYGCQGIPNVSPSLITPLESLGEKQKDEIFPRHMSDVAHILSGKIPTDMTYANTRIGSRKDAIIRVIKIAKTLAKDLEYSACNGEISPDASSSLNYFYDTALPVDAIAHFSNKMDISNSAIYERSGLWSGSYVSEEVRKGVHAESLALEGNDDTAKMIDHLKSLGFDPACVVVETLEGSDAIMMARGKGCRIKLATDGKLKKYFFRGQKAFAVISISRDTSSTIQFSKRLHQLAFAEVVYQVFRDESREENV
jgi:hypothetical protein